MKKIAVLTSGGDAPGMNAAIRAVLQMPDVRRLLVERGYDIVGSTPEQYAANIRSEMAKWENVVRTTNMERLY